VLKKRSQEESSEMVTRMLPPYDSVADFEQKMAALSYLHEAWAEALHDGIDGDCIAQAALFSALNEMIAVYGEDATAKFTDNLSARIRQGEFTLPGSKQ
jgi:hypothetical protein